MTEEERLARLAEIDAARAHYEQLRAAYEREGSVNGQPTLASAILPSPRERMQHEQSFRRGYWLGAREALTAVDPDGWQTGVWDWAQHALPKWVDRAKPDGGQQTPPPLPPTK